LEKNFDVEVVNDLYDLQRIGRGNDCDIVAVTANSRTKGRYCVLVL
jgi:hypothetical protein